MNVTKNVPQPRNVDNRVKQVKILHYYIKNYSLKDMESEINKLLADGWKIDKKYLVHNDVSDKQTGFVVWMTKKIEV